MSVYTTPSYNIRSPKHFNQPAPNTYRPAIAPENTPSERQPYYNPSTKKPSYPKPTITTAPKQITASPSVYNPQYVDLTTSTSLYTTKTTAIDPPVYNSPSAEATTSKPSYPTSDVPVLPIPPGYCYCALYQALTGKVPAPSLNTNPTQISLQFPSSTYISTKTTPPPVYQKPIPLEAQYMEPTQREDISESYISPNPNFNDQRPTVFANKMAPAFQSSPSITGTPLTTYQAIPNGNQDDQPIQVSSSYTIQRENTIYSLHNQNYSTNEQSYKAQQNNQNIQKISTHYQQPTERPLADSLPLISNLPSSQEEPINDISGNYQPPLSYQLLNLETQYRQPDSLNPDKAVSSKFEPVLLDNASAQPQLLEKDYNRDSQSYQPPPNTIQYQLPPQQAALNNPTSDPTQQFLDKDQGTSNQQIIEQQPNPTLFYNSIKPTAESPIKPSADQPKPDSEIEHLELQLKARYPNLEAELKRYIQSLQSGTQYQTTTSQTPTSSTASTASTVKETEQLTERVDLQISDTAVQAHILAKIFNGHSPKYSESDQKQDSEHFKPEILKPSLEFEQFEDDSDPEHAESEMNHPDSHLINKSSRKMNLKFDPRLASSYRMKFPSYFRGFDYWNFLY